MTVTVLAGGRLLDPGTSLDGPGDVVVTDGRIAAVGPLDERRAPAECRAPDARVIDCSGAVVIPGLIDLHAHVYPGLGDFCVEPDLAGVDSGVPVVVDGGTSGVSTFGLARRVIDDPAVRTRVLAWMDPCLLYLATRDFLCHRLELANDPRNLVLDQTAAALEAHGDVIVGLKVRACWVDDPHVSPFVEGAKAVAGPKPIMIHLGRFPHTPTISAPDLLRTLRPGDVVTHAFRGASGLLDAAGVPTPEFRDALERGVRLDVGHSGTDFRFATARRLFDLGIRPDTVSTDLNVFNVDGPVRSLAETLSKIWALGVDLDEIIAMATLAPAAVIGRASSLGALLPGRTAEVSVLRIDEGPVELSDGYETLTAERYLTPVGCLRGDAWYPATARNVVERPGRAA
ncbi:MAG: amidohydrolase/deacetylase family metallohydrolase [Acidimicrobiales bacterium]